MTLREFATLVGAAEKWVLNTRSALGLTGAYTLAGARRLAVAREIAGSFSIPLRLAYESAQWALAQYDSGKNPAAIHPLQPVSNVHLSVDVGAILATQAARHSAFLSLAAPRLRGPKPARPRNAVTRARDFGIDLTLLRANLARTPQQRLRQLDAMAEFQRKAKRVSIANR